MKNLFAIFFALAIFIAAFSPQAASSNAQDSSYIKVGTGYVCKGIINRRPLGIGKDFDTSVEKLYCYTRIICAQHPIEITHVWYFGNVKRAEVKLTVRSSNWRTYSSKIIQQNEVGDWHIDVLGPEGNVLKILQFRITH